MQPNCMETVNGGPETLNVEQDSGKPECFQCAFFWCLTPSDKWIMLMPTSSNCIIPCACVSRTMRCGKLLPGITLIMCNENKHNSTVDFNRLTQFSTPCLMWLEQSNYTVFPQGSREHIIGFSNAFIWGVIEVYFPPLWALTYTSKSNNGFPIVLTFKNCFPICETLTTAQWNLWFHDWLWSIHSTCCTLNLLYIKTHQVVLGVIYQVLI